MQRVSSEKLRGHLDSLVLASLERGDAHGWEISKRIETAGSGALQLKEGSLYPALYRLEEAKLIKGKWESETSTRRGARRRLYRLTAKGRKHLAAGRQEWQEFVSVIGEALGVTP